MLTKKSIAMIGLSVGLSVCSLSGYAQSLTIVNNTDLQSTSIINNGICSSQLGNDGITQPHSTHVINDKIIALACFGNTNNCRADVYMTNNCSGSLIATVTFDTKIGIKAIKNYSAKYNFTNDAFNIIINSV